MKTNLKAITAAVALCALGVAPALSAPAPKVSASGTVTVNGKTSKIAYAYAHEVRGFFAPKKPDIEVILSDVSLPAKALASSGERARLAATGKVHTFEITIDRTGKPVSSTFNNNAFTGPSPSGLDSSDVLTVRTLVAKSLEATYRSAEVHDFFGSQYSFDVAFNVPISK